jgi:F0F1-type ATP synthase epsilon subunit
MSILKTFKQPVLLSEDLLSDLKQISSTGKSQKVNLSGGSLDVDKDTATMLLKTYEKLNDQSRKKMLKLLNKSAYDFMKIVNFGWNRK